MWSYLEGKNGDEDVEIWLQQKTVVNFVAARRDVIAGKEVGAERRGE